MNHKTDMQAALQACVDVLLHDGVLTDPEHPKRIALDAAEAILASRPDAQADERGAFEAWVKSEYGYSTERYELGGYKRPELNMWWTTWQARAAAPQAEAAQGVAEGWKLVPIEPTPEMVKAGSTSGGLGMDFHEWMGRIILAWRHMLAASHSPDREQVGEAGKRFRCAARKQGTAGGNYPAECDWPMCGCDEHATRVIEALQESGHLRDASPSREHGKQECPHSVDDGACKQCYGEATSGEQGEAKGVCQRCGGTGVVDDGEITGAGVEFENGPVKCVKDCQDCADSAPAKAEAKCKACKACNGNDGDMPCAYPEGRADCLRNASAPTLGETVQGKPMATTAEFDVAIETLRHVIECLRNTGRYTDEEGEATDFLEPLLYAHLSTPQPQVVEPLIHWRDKPQNIALLAAERGDPVDCDGTFACPICGKDEPHQHSSEEIAKFRTTQPQAAEPKELTDEQCEELRLLARTYNKVGFPKYAREWLARALLAKGA